MLFAKPPMSYVRYSVFPRMPFSASPHVFWPRLLSRRLYTFRYVWENQAHVVVGPSPLSSFKKHLRKSMLTNSKCLLSFFCLYTQMCTHYTDIYTDQFFFFFFASFLFLHCMETRVRSVRSWSQSAKMKQARVLCLTWDPNQNPSERKC